MISYLRRASSYQSTFMKRGFQFSNEKLTEAQSQAVQRHRAIIAMRIIKFIQIDPYKDSKIPLNFNIQKSSNVMGSNGVVLLQHEIPKAQPSTEQKPSIQDKESQPFPFLTTRIIELIRKYSDTNANFNEADSNASSNWAPEHIAQRKMMNIFQEGVWVYEDLCNQQRFNPETENYQNLLQNNQIVEEAPFQSERGKERYSQNYKKLIFCPTYLVTGQVFRLVQSRKKYLLITGQYGSGKSYSFILYRLLSDIIFRYKHRFCPYKKKLPSEINLNQVPKLVYWSLDLQKSSQEEVEAIIMRQCYELKKQDPNFRLFNQRRGQRKLSIIYQNYLGINVLLLDDQIHMIASAKRRFDNYVAAQNKLKQNEEYKNLVFEAKSNPEEKIELKEYQKKIESQLRKQFGEYYPIQQKFILGDKLNNIKQKVRVQFDKVFYLSSKTIEANQMIYLNLNGQQKHTPISKTEFKYRELFKKPPSISDSVEFISFLFEQQYKQLIKKNSNQNSQVVLTEEQQKFLSQLREELFQILSKNEFMISPLAAAFSFSEYRQKDQNSLEIFAKQSNRSKLNQNLKKFIDQLNDESFKIINQQVSRFLVKNQTPQMGKIKRILLLKLLYAAQTKIMQRIQNPQNKSQDTLFQIQLSDLFTLKIQDLQMQVDLHLDRNLFRFKGNKKFICLLHDKIVLKLLADREKELLQAYLDSDKKIYNLQKNNSSKGHLVEGLLRDILSTEDTSFKIELIKSKKVEDNENLQYKQLVSFNKLSQQVQYFTPIPRINETKYRFFNFLEGFGKNLETISDGYHFFLPSSNFLTVQNKQDIQVLDASTSKLIDFIIVRRINDDFVITAFDATILLEDAEKKISQFLVEFANFEDCQKQQFTDKKYKVSLHYVVLVPKVPKRPLKWWTHYNKEKKLSMQKIQKQIQIQKKNFNISFVNQLCKKSTFLEELSFPNNNGYHSEVRKESKNGSNQSSQQVLLKSVAISSFLDAIITNKKPQMISFQMRLLDRFRKDTEQKEIKQRKIKQAKPKVSNKLMQKNQAKFVSRKNSQNVSSQKDSLQGYNQTKESNFQGFEKSQNIESSEKLPNQKKSKKK